VTAKRDLDIPELSFVLDGTLRTDALDDEAIQFRCLLESLLPTPWKIASSESPDVNVPVNKTHKSCCDGEQGRSASNTYGVRDCAHFWKTTLAPSAINM
jgi:hypothetical protein